MARFLIRRIALAILVMWIISVIVFVLFFLGDPHVVAARLAGKNATPQAVAAVYRSLGFDHSAVWQYGHFLDRLIHGDLGNSYFTGQTVNSLLKQDLPPTLSLAIGASFLWLGFGVLNGVVAAVRPRTIADRGMTFFALFFYSMPTFLLGVVLLDVFFYELTVHGLRWFPPGGYVPLTQNPLEWAHHLILPWITLALVLAASYTRLTRASMLDVLGEDYIRTARAKGLSESRVVFRHGLRSALTPILTQFGIDLATLVGGVVVTETVFALGGVGQLALNSVVNQDLPVIIGTVLFASFVVVVVNIIVDIMYAVLDPRVRLS
ncbi:MAG TPA: ABC transporter permease [Mycobacteriales bacterium]|nr:ABC transporter permease [Mycobacteriales bacterium]